MRYVIGVGSNRGDRVATIDRSADLLAASASVLARSPMLETAAWGGPPGSAAFLNTAWLVETGLGPHQLLLHCQRIEQACGRTRSLTNGPRTLDLDLLICDDGRCWADPVLQLPHPGLAHRRFALEPAVAVAAEWQHPLYRCSLAQLLADLPEDAP
jgi:2-amino-4-hydroxy-6-hydroxymethyldihydropteridine diphosphokinase